MGGTGISPPSTDLKTGTFLSERNKAQTDAQSCKAPSPGVAVLEPSFGALAERLRILPSVRPLADPRGKVASSRPRPNPHRPQLEPSNTG
jgi:hypothetical protein